MKGKIKIGGTLGVRWGLSVFFSLLTSGLMGFLSTYAYILTGESFTNYMQMMKLAAMATLIAAAAGFLLLVFTMGKPLRGLISLPISFARFFTGRGFRSPVILLEMSFLLIAALCLFFYFGPMIEIAAYALIWIFLGYLAAAINIAGVVMVLTMGKGKPMLTGIEIFLSAIFLGGATYLLLETAYVYRAVLALTDQIAAQGGSLEQALADNLYNFYLGLPFWLAVIGSVLFGVSLALLFSGGENLDGKNPGKKKARLLRLLISAVVLILTIMFYIYTANANLNVLNIAAAITLPFMLVRGFILMPRQESSRG
jgi:hypothetical protein